jgi:hypothetical protein
LTVTPKDGNDSGFLVFPQEKWTSCLAPTKKSLSNIWILLDMLKLVYELYYSYLQEDTEIQSLGWKQVLLDIPLIYATSVFRTRIDFSIPRLPDLEVLEEARAKETN